MAKQGVGSIAQSALRTDVFGYLHSPSLATLELKLKALEEIGTDKPLIVTGVMPNWQGDNFTVKALPDATTMIM